MSRSSLGARPLAVSAAHSSISFWFDSLGALPAPRPPLQGRREADVCIVGAGLTGLWTAYELRRADPALEVVVLEREIAGFGASGRNGGWVSAEIAGSRDYWATRGGRAAVQRIEAAGREAVDEVGRVMAQERIDCDFVKGGSLEVAQTDLELHRLRARTVADRKWGVSEDDCRLLQAAAVQERVALRHALGGRYTPHCARVQPASLVRGLAEAAERHGVTIYEHTPVRSVQPRLVRTSAAEVHARWVVRATEAYTPELPGLRRALVPVSSAMIVTEPLHSSAWGRLRWHGAETLLDGRHMYSYLQRTADGRIAIGGSGAPYGFGSRIGSRLRVADAVIARLATRLRELFDLVGDVGIDAAWQGFLGVTRNWAPAVEVDRATGLASAGGYAGSGVAAANLAGRTLRDLILARDTELTVLPWVGSLAASWELEPLRFAGIRTVNTLLRTGDRLEARFGRPSRLAKLANRLAGSGR